MELFAGEKPTYCQGTLANNAIQRRTGPHNIFYLVIGGVIVTAEITWLALGCGEFSDNFSFILTEGYS